jgi:hypothetical protein
MPATMKVVEATGDGLRRIATSVNILGVDGFTLTDTNFDAYPIRVLPTSGISTSYERWFRFEFSGTYQVVNDFRFWMPGLTVNAGWTLLWGIADTFSRPTNSDSVIAVNPVPVLDPGIENLPPGMVDDPVLPLTRDASAWLVLQASVEQDAQHGQLVDGGLTYQFTWAEY